MLIGMVLSLVSKGLDKESPIRMLQPSKSLQQF